MKDLTNGWNVDKKCTRCRGNTIAMDNGSPKINMCNRCGGTGNPANGKHPNLPKRCRGYQCAKCAGDKDPFKFHGRKHSKWAFWRWGSEK